MTDLVFIPGLGADQRQFAPQRDAFPHMRVLPWLEPLPYEPLKLYALRLAATAGVTSDAVIAGSSFGGMLALEIARSARCRAAVLIGSCRSPGQVSPILKQVELCSRAVPSVCLGAAMPLGVPLLPLIEPVSREQARLLVTMAQDTGAPFLKYGARAVFEWEGCPDPGVPIFHIHGASDRVIPVARVKPDAVITGHGHALNLTAPAEVNRALVGFLTKV